MVPEARAIVRHGVDRSRDVGDLVVEAVGALMEARLAAQVRGCLVRGDGPLPEAGDGRGVVAEGGKCALPEVELLGRHNRLGRDACLLEVAVGEAAVRVLEADYFPLDVLRERGPPEQGRVPVG
jgi:hypothetical protein